MRSKNTFKNDISVAKGLSSEEMCKFSDIVEIMEKPRALLENVLKLIEMKLVKI